MSRCSSEQNPSTSAGAPHSGHHARRAAHHARSRVNTQPRLPPQGEPVNPSSPNEPSQMEPVPVQLTRIEGTVNLIAYQIGEVRTEVKELGQRVTAVELTQAASHGGQSFLKAWLPTIIAAVGVMAALGFGIKFGG